MIRFEDIKPPRKKAARPSPAPAGKKLGKAKKAMARALSKPKGQHMAKQAAAQKEKRPVSGALAKPVTPDQALAAVVGDQPMPRTAIVSKLWEYIRANNLQNPDNRREILADDKLRPIFGADKITMFELNKVLSQHVTA